MARNFRFSQFVPRLFNYVTQKGGMEPGLIMPARAFCSDGSQGYPTMLMAKHFGTFPFDYGQIGGTFDFNRSPAYVSHGRDLVVVQATHVGYDETTKTYGKYPRHRTSTDPEHMVCTSNCGHVSGVTKPYVKAYQSAANHTLIAKNRATGQYHIYLRNFFLTECSNSRFSFRVKFDIDRMLLLTGPDRDRLALYVSKDPVSRTFIASDEFARHLDKYKIFAEDSSVEEGKFFPLGEALTREWFTFERTPQGSTKVLGQYEENIQDQMDWVVTHPQPLLAAAQVCVQAEFHRFLTEIYFSKSTFENRNLFYIAGVIVDVAPSSDQIRSQCAFYPRSLFVPWAAHVQRQGENKLTPNNNFVKETWDQDRIFKEFEAVDAANPRAMCLDAEMDRLTCMPNLNL